MAKEKKLSAKEKRVIKKALRNKTIFWTVVSLILLVAVGFAIFYFAFPEQWNKVFGGGSEINVTNAEGELTIHFLDVGQGDSIIIQLPDGKNMIIDAGGSTDNNNNKSPKDVILGAIKKLKIKTFDYMILTHTDADHVDFMDEVLKATDVKNIYRPAFLSKSEAEKLPGSNYATIETKTYDNFVKAVEDEQNDKKVNAQVYYNVKGQAPAIEGTGYHMEIQAVEEKHYMKSEVGEGSQISAYEKNFVSPFCVLTFGSTTSRTIVFTGDAEGESKDYDGDKVGNGAEEEYLKVYNPKYDADVLKVGHHGSAASSDNELLNAIDPEYAIISCGVESKHGHPRKEMLDRLDSYVDKGAKKDDPQYEIDKKITKYSTAANGNITLHIDKEGNMEFSSTLDLNNSTKPGPTEEDKKPKTLFVADIFRQEEYGYAMAC